MSANFYSAPTYMSGGAFTIYSGSRRQMGGGFLGSLRSAMAPMGRNILKGFKSLARNKTVQDIAKTAAQKGAEVLTGVAVDALQGQNIGQSLEARSKRAALEALIGNKEPVAKRRKVTIKSEKSKKVFKQKNGIKRKNKSSKGKLSRAELNRRELF